jgi:iron(II)-dependent oxidoreductase
MKNMRGTRMKKAQRKRISAAILAAATWTTLGAAQDTKSASRGQQIPPPACLTLKGAWEGGGTPCTDATHQQWLADISHWRTERRIRVG